LPAAISIEVATDAPSAASSRRQFAARNTLRIWVDAARSLPVPEFQFIPPCNQSAAKAVPSGDSWQH